MTGREGDEIEMVIDVVTDISDLRKAKIVGDGTWMTTSGRHPRWFGEELFPEIAERITVIRPEIIPGQLYIDAAGNLYMGRRLNRLMAFGYDSNGRWIYSNDPRPVGLRPAKAVAE